MVIIGVYTTPKNSTIFKQYINDLRNVQSVINSISNVEVFANGSTGLLNANSLNSLSSAISGLSKEQALLVLSTKNLTQAQQEQVLVEAGIIASNDKINASLVKRALTESTLTQAQQKEVLTELGLVDAKTGEIVATNACTKAALEEVLAKKGIIGADADAIISSIGLSSANSTQAISFDVLTASIWANIKALGKWLITNPIGWAILGTTAIFGLVKAYDALTDSTEEVKERTDALLDSYNSAISEANSNAKTIESLASRYETLSKGVNNLGENVSLTADEYSEYNDIVNQIAEMFPTMITGYTDEGNAILSLKGNVEELRDAYKEAQKEAYNLLIVSGKDNDGNDIITNYQNQINGKESFLSTTSSYIDGEGGAKDAIDIITRLTGALTPDEFRETYNQLYEEYENIWNSDKIKEALKSSGFEDLASNWSKITSEDLANVKSSAKATIQTYQAEIDAQLQNVRTLANAYLMTNSDYEKLDEQSKTAISLLVNSIDENIANGFKDKADVGAYVNELISSISNDDKAKKALSDLFTMNTDDMTVGEIQSNVDAYVSVIAKTIDEDSNKLKIRLGFDYTDTEPLINKVQGFLSDEFDNKVGELTLEDLDIASKLEIPEGTLLSWDELISKINEAKNTSDKTSVSSFSEAWSGAPDDLQTKLKELAEQGKLTKEEFENTDSENYFDGLGISADEAVNKINQLVSSSTQLESMSAQISKMSDMLADKKNGTVASASDLAGFNAEVRGLDSWKEFETVMGSSKSSMEECQKAANALATEWVNSGNFLANLTEENKDYYVTQLQNMGIENAEEVVTQELTRQKALLTAQAEYETLATEYNSDAKNENNQVTTDLTNATISEIAEIIAEGNATSDTQKAMAEFALSKFDVNNEKIDTSSDVKSIIAIANAAGASAEYVDALRIALENLVKAEKGKKQTSSLPTAGIGAAMANMAAEENVKYNKNAVAEALENAKKSIKGNKLKASDYIVKPTGSSNYKGGSSGGKSKSGSGKDKTNDTKQTVDWIERKLERLQKIIDATKSKFENLFTVKSKSSNLDKQIKQTTSLMKANEKAAKKYKSYADKYAKKSGLSKSLIKKIQNGDYSITDYDDKTAEKINKYKEYWDNYKEAKKNVDELTTSVRELKEEKLQLYVDDADARKELIDSEIELVTSGKNKNKLEKDKIKYIKQSYNKQIEIAKIEKDSVKVSQLRIDKEKELLAVKKEILQNTLDQNEKEKELLDAKYQNANSAKDKNKIIDKRSKLDTNDVTAYRDSYNDAKKTLSSTSKKVNKATSNAKSLSDSDRKKIDSYIKSGKVISKSLLKKVKAVDSNWYDTLVNYNNKYADRSSTLKAIKNSKVSKNTQDNLEKAINSGKTISKKTLGNVKKKDPALYKNLDEWDNEQKNRQNIIKKISSTKTLTSGDKKKIKSLVDGKKPISDSLLRKVASANPTLYAKLVKYNADLEYRDDTKYNLDVAVEKDKTKKRQDTKEKFDNIDQEYSMKIGYQENRKSAVQDALDLAEAKGQLIGSAYYTKQKGINDKEISQYKKEEAELKKAMKDVPKYSEEWYNMKSKISEVHSKYVQLQADNAELQNSINELKFDRFDELINKFDDIIDESDFLIGLLDSDNLFNSDNGSITNDGITAMGLTAQNYDVYLAQAEEYKKSIADLEQMYKNGEIGISDYNSKMRELQGGYRDSIKSANDAKKAVID